MGSLIILLVGLITYYNYKYESKERREKAQLYEQFAKRLGFTYRKEKSLGSSYDRLTGKRGELSVTVYERHEGRWDGSNKQKTIVTRAVVGPIKTSLEFTLQKENFTSKLVKIFGWNDIELGDNEFNEKFLLKSKHEDKIRLVFDQNMINQIKEIEKDFNGHLHLENFKMVYVFQDVLQYEAMIRSFEKVLELMLALSDRIQKL